MMWLMMIDNDNDNNDDSRHYSAVFDKVDDDHGDFKKGDDEIV